MHFSRTFFLFSVFALAACSGGETREFLGLDRKAPDEFVVYSRPPLSVPPEFDLQPPQPGAPPLGTSTEEIAKETLLGSSSKERSFEEEDAKISLDEGEPAEEVERDPLLTEEEPALVEPIEASEPDSGATESFLGKAGADEASPDIRQQLGEDAEKAPERTEDAESLYEQLMGAEDEPVVDAKGEAERIRTNKDEGKPITEGETPTEDEKEKSVIDQIF